MLAGGGRAPIIRALHAPFLDLVVLGEGGEEVLGGEIIDVFKDWKLRQGRRREFLAAAAQVPGVYVPEFYAVYYSSQGHITSVCPPPNPVLRSGSRSECCGSWT